MILLISFYPIQHPVTIYRIINLQKIIKKYLPDQQVEIEHVPNLSVDFEKKLKQAKIIIVSRIDANAEFANHFINLLQQKKEEFKLFMDIDDLLGAQSVFQMGIVKSHLSNPLSLIKQFNTSTFNMISSNVDYIIGSTELIADYYKSNFGKKTLVIPNLIDPIYINTDTKKQEINNSFNILFTTGSNIHEFDFSYIVLDLINFLQKYKKANLIILGPIADITKQLLSKINCMFYNKTSYNAMLSMMFRYDLIVFPLDNNNYNKAKSNIQYLESAASKTPIMATGIGEFIKVIKDKYNGILVNDDNSNWFECLEYAYNNREKLHIIAENANNDVVNNWSINRFMSNDLQIFLQEIENVS